MLKITPSTFLLSLSLILSLSINTVYAEDIKPKITNAHTPSFHAFDFKVSPNPAENFIKIKFNTNVTADLFIHDGVGNEVLSERINNESNKQISLHDLNSGIYFVSVKVNDKTVIKRLIKY